MSDTSQGPGWWQASDGKWYSPEQHPDAAGAGTTPPTPPESAPTQQQPPVPPAATPPAAGPTGAPPPYGAPPAGGPGAAPPYAAPGAYAGGPTPPGTPPAGAPPAGSGGNGGKIALIVIIVLILVGIGVGAFLLLSGDGDDDVATEETTTTTTEDTTTTSGPRRTLVERTTTTEGRTTTTEDSSPTTDPLTEELEAALGLDVDPETLDCTLTAVLSDPALTEAMTSEDVDPTSPEFAALLTVLVDCGGRTQLEDAFLEGMGSGGLDQASIDCVATQLAALDDAQFVVTIVGLASEDPAAMAVVSSCI